MHGSFAWLILAAMSIAGIDLPRFEDYPSPVDWQGPAATIKLITRSARMFRTRLSEAANEPANFAGHYRITYWGWGSDCAASAVMDLDTGDVYPPALGGKDEGGGHWISCASSFAGTGDEFHVNSRLLIVRCGANFDRNGKNRPDVYYLLWEGNRFRELLHLRPEQYN